MLSGAYEHMAETQEYSLCVKKLDSGEWYLATSEQMPKLMVHGKSIDQIRERAPEIIKRLLEREGKAVENVSIDPPAPDTPTCFTTFSVTAVLAA